MILLNIVKVTEVLAAIFGTRYILLHKKNRPVKYLVYFLWFTVFIEIITYLPILIKTHGYFPNLKSTIWANNQWVFNIYDIISFSFYIYFFLTQLKIKRKKYTIYASIISFTVISVLYLLNSDVFFQQAAAFNMIVGASVIFILIGVYWYQLLISNDILHFYRTITFYIACGILPFLLATVPLFIFSSYYDTSISPVFVNIHNIVLMISNIYLYIIYSVGFIICYKRSKYYSLPIL